MGVCKGTMVSFVPTLFGYFLGIPSLYLFIFLMFFCDVNYSVHFTYDGVMSLQKVQPIPSCRKKDPRIN